MTGPAVSGGTGTWDAGSNWWNGAADQAWADANDAVFAGSAGTVTIGGAVAPSSMNFQTDAYTVTGGSLAATSLTVGAGLTATVGSTVTGAGTFLTKAGDGTLILSNAGNTFGGDGGGVNINAGVLQIDSDGALGALQSAPANYVNLNGGTLRFGAAFAGLDSFRTINIGAAGGTIDTNFDITGSGPKITGGTLTKTGTGGYSALQAANPFSQLILKGGRFTVSSAAGLPTDNVTLDGYANGAVLFPNNNGLPASTSPTTTLTLGADGGAIITALPSVSTTWNGPLLGSGTFHGQNGPIILTSDLTTATTTFAGSLASDSINGYVELTGQLNSLVTFSGNNNAAGGVKVSSHNASLSTPITVNPGGIVIARFDDSLGTGDINVDGGTVGGGDGSGGGPVGVTLAQKINFTANGLTVRGWNGTASPAGGGTGAGDTVTFTGVITDNGTGGGFTKGNPPGEAPFNIGGFTTAVLTNTGNSWGGATTISGGMLVLGASNVLPQTTSVTLGGGNGKQLAIPAGVSQTIAQLKGSGFVTLNGALTVGDSNNFDNGNTLFGSGTLIKVGSGIMQTTQPNTGPAFSGPVIVKGGEIFANSGSNASNSIGDSSATNTLTLDGGGLKVGDDFTSARAVIIGAGGGTFDLQRRGNPTFSGLITGTAPILITQKTALTGTDNRENAGLRPTANNGGAAHGGAGSGYSGPITIAGGALLITNNNLVSGVSYSAGDASATNTITFDTPLLSVRRSVLKIEQSGVTVPQAISIPTGVTGVVIVNDGNGNTGTLSGPISGGGTLLKDGQSADGTTTGGRSRGTLILTADNSAFTGPINVTNRGVLQVGASNNLGSAGPDNNITMDFGGTLKTTGAFSSNRIISVGQTAQSTGGNTGGTLDSNGFDSSWGDLIKASGAGGGVFNKINGGTISFARINPAHATPFTVNLSAGTLALTAGAATTASVVSSLSVTSSKFDLTNNKLVVVGGTVGTPDTANTYSGLTGLIQSGRNGGGWGGSGIVTSQTDATTGNFTSIGIATGAQVKPNSATETALWAGQTITGTDALVMYTYGGDANLDGKINVDDYGHIDSSIGIGLTGWYNGDFNYDGKINVDDYGIIDFNIGIQGAPFSTASGSSGVSGVSAVPEPTTASVVIAAAATSLLRRRRQPLK